MNVSSVTGDEDSVHAQLCNLSHKTSETYSLEEFRSLLGVPPGKYKSFGELNKHVLKPAAAEVAENPRCRSAQLRVMERVRER